jgi:aminoglycoside phosphotransferase (APT) family kinase protein
MDFLSGGRDADVFRHGEGLVLRRYRDGRSAEAEGALMREIHSLGYPIPRVESVTGPDLVMELVSGPSLAAAGLRGDITPAESGRILAELLDRLHALPWPGGEVRLHLDLHPFNVLMSERGPVVIDWSNSRIGPPALDIAMTALILAQVATNPVMLTADPALTAALPAGATTNVITDQLTGVLRSFVAHSATPYLNHLSEAEAFRRGDRYQSEDELARLQDAVDLVVSVADSPPSPDGS